MMVVVVIVIVERLTLTQFVCESVCVSIRIFFGIFPCCSLFEGALEKNF